MNLDHLSHETCKRLLVEALDLLNQVAEEIDGEIDVVDGSDGPLPNWAMSMTQDIDEWTARLNRKPRPQIPAQTVEPPQPHE